jgi:hypothetical protein
MNSVAEALNTLISAVNVAHNKGGVYSLEESHHIYMAISYINSLQNQNKSQQESKSETKQEPQQPDLSEDEYYPTT